VNPPAAPDQAYVAAALQGERQAFGVLVSRYHQPIYLMLARMFRDAHLADDAAQEAFVKAWQKLHTYQPERPFGAWIRSIAVRTALDLLRKEKPMAALDTTTLVVTSPRTREPGRGRPGGRSCASGRPGTTTRRAGRPSAARVRRPVLPGDRHRPPYPGRDGDVPLELRPQPVTKSLAGGTGWLALASNMSPVGYLPIMMENCLSESANALRGIWQPARHAGQN
jgi:RNA polymerase sigma factor (sigma-70 family)